jgi:hypothetical protein
LRRGNVNCCQALHDICAVRFVRHKARVLRECGVQVCIALGRRRPSVYLVCGCISFVPLAKQQRGSFSIVAGPGLILVDCNNPSKRSHVVGCLVHTTQV